jgi:hypothetical protein
LDDLADVIGVDHVKSPTHEGDVDLAICNDQSTELFEQFGWSQIIRMGEL